MKRDNTIEQLRGPKATESTKVMADKMAFTGYVSYGEMIPGSPKEGLSPQSEYYNVFHTDGEVVTPHTTMRLYSFLLH